MKCSTIRRVVAGLVAVAMVAGLQSNTMAQGACCPTQVTAFSPVVAQPMVAFSPVVAQPTVTFEEYRGWYPGKWLDRMRLRRFGYTAPATSTFAAAPMASPYTVGFAPTATTVFMAPTTTTAFMAPAAPHVTAFAPLGQHSLRRQVVLSPVVTASPVMAVADPCAVCPAPACPAPVHSSPVGQASFIEPACPACPTASVLPSYTPSNGAPYSGPVTPQPQLTPQEAAPLRTEYPPTNGNSTYNNGQQNGEGRSESPPPDPGPAMYQSDDANSYLEPPKLFNTEDRTAKRGPTVDVWHAVHRQPVTTSEVSQSNAPRTQAEIDADGWHSVPSGR